MFDENAGTGITISPAPVSVAHVKYLQELVEKQETEINTLKVRIGTTNNNLNDVLHAVREKAIELCSDGTICRDGMNDFFEQVGIEKYTPTFEVSFTIVGTVTLEADSEDDAETMFKNGIIVYLDSDSDGVNYDIDHVSAEYSGNN